MESPTRNRRSRSPCFAHGTGDDAHPLVRAVARCGTAGPPTPFSACASDRGAKTAPFYCSLLTFLRSCGARTWRRTARGARNTRRISDTHQYPLQPKGIISTTPTASWGMDQRFDGSGGWKVSTRLDLRSLILGPLGRSSDGRNFSGPLRGDLGGPVCTTLRAGHRESVSRGIPDAAFSGPQDIGASGVGTNPRLALSKPGNLSGHPWEPRAKLPRVCVVAVPGRSHIPRSRDNHMQGSSARKQPILYCTSRRLTPFFFDAVYNTTPSWTIDQSIRIAKG